jgi:hypothetical protein
LWRVDYGSQLRLASVLRIFSVQWYGLSQKPCVRAATLHSRASPVWSAGTLTSFPSLHLFSNRRAYEKSPILKEQHYKHLEKFQRFVSRKNQQIPFFEKTSWIWPSSARAIQNQQYISEGRWCAASRSFSTISGGGGENRDRPWPGVETNMTLSFMLSFPFLTNYRIYLLATKAYILMYQKWNECKLSEEAMLLNCWMSSYSALQRCFSMLIDLFLCIVVCIWLFFSYLD